MPGRGSGKSKSYGSNNPRSNDNRDPIDSGYNDVSDMFDTMFTDHRSDSEKQLQEARVKSFLSGFPLIGPFIQGVERAQQLEDLYDSTGKTPAYPATSGVGYGGIGHSVGSALTSGLKVMDGINDLYHFYSGSPDGFRNMENQSYW